MGSDGEPTPIYSENSLPPPRLKYPLKSEKERFENFNEKAKKWAENRDSSQRIETTSNSYIYSWSRKVTGQAENRVIPS